MDDQLVLDAICDAALQSTDSTPFKDALSILPAFLESHRTEEMAYARYLRELASDKVADCADPDEMVRCIEQILKLNAPEDLDSYMLYTEWDRKPGKRFWRPRREILMPVCMGFQDLEDGLVDKLVVSLPPRVGKALAFDTPVLADNGWKMHGDLVVGDRVLAPDGRFVDVLAVHPPCEMEFEVEFSNGERIVCHGNHEWEVFNRHRQKQMRMTTRQMFEDKVSDDGRGRGLRNYFMLPNRMPADGVEKELPIKPYTLGAWLGDGRNRNPDVCFAKNDVDVLNGILKDGYEIAWLSVHKTTGVRYCGFKELRSQLQSVGMCHSRRTVPKHIPDAYFSASLEQRLMLLAGLIDTDGCLIGKGNRYQFSTAEPELMDSFVRLVSTFGWRCSVTEHEPHSHDRITGRRTVWVVAFNPTFEVPCRLERKRMRTFSKQRRISIRSITPKTGVVGNCITVDGGMYCAGKTLLPTHNSTTGIFAMSWHMGRNPDEANLMSGHSDKLTSGFHQEALALVKSAEYRFHDVFPQSTVLKYSLQEETIQLKSIRRFPSLTCRAIGGTLTGAVEVGKGGWLYCDDLVSDREEAMSEERMQKLYEAYMNQLVDRKLDGAKEVHVSTRWCPNDPIGVLLDTEGPNSRTRVIVIPALDSDGESNFLYGEGHAFSTEYYLDQRDRLVASGQEDSWEAKFMGAPYHIGGLMFPVDSLRRYSELPEGEPDAILAVCDTKDRGTDYAVQVVGYVYGDDHYIHSVVCDNALPQVVEPKLAEQLFSHRVSLARYESNGAGGRIADDVAESVRARGHVIEMQKRYTTENKETRIIVDSGWVVERCLFRDVPPDQDYAKFIDMLTHYTTMGKNRNDDAPDAMSMYKRLVSSTLKASIEPIARPF